MAKAKSDSTAMPLIGHLAELRSRLLRSAAAVGAAATLCFYFTDRILAWMRRSLGEAANSQLVFLSPAEAFWASLKVALFAGCLLALPVILYQGWRFVAPGLLPRERMALFPFLFFGLAGFAAGLLFGYFVALPFGMGFLIRYGREGGMVPMLSVSLYVDFYIKFLLAFGLIFELPFAILVLTRMGVLSAETLARNRRYAIFLSFFAGAVLTPTPDIFNQMLMTLPLILLYEVGIWVSRLLGKAKRVESSPEPSSHPPP